MKTKLKHFDPKDWKLIVSILLTISLLLICIGIGDSLTAEKYAPILNDPNGISDATVFGFSMAIFVVMFFLFLRRLWKTIDLFIPVIKKKWGSK